jgi:hypothetical protein
MTDCSIVTQLPLFPDALLPPKKTEKQATLHTYWQQPAQLPSFVSACPTARRFLDLVGPLDWACLPERDLERNWGNPTIPYRAIIATCCSGLGGNFLGSVKAKAPKPTAA